MSAIRKEVAQQESMRLAAEVQKSLLPNQEISHPLYRFRRILSTREQCWRRLLWLSMPLRWQHRHVPRRCYGTRLSFSDGSCNDQKLFTNTNPFWRFSVWSHESHHPSHRRFTDLYLHDLLLSYYSSRQPVRVRQRWASADAALSQR